MSFSYHEMKVARGPNSWIVSLSGDVDYAASLELAPQLADIAEQCETELCLDLGAVTLIDSEGIKALMGAYATMRSKNGRVCVTNCSRQAYRVLHLVGADDMLGISPDSQDCSPNSDLPLIWSE